MLDAIDFVVVPCIMSLLLQAEGCYNPGEYVGLVYSDRMRTSVDKQHIFCAFSEVFGPESEVYSFSGQWSITSSMIQVSTTAAV